MQGKVVLITGAASGLGRLASHRLADAGARVVACDVNADGLRGTAADRPGITTRVLDVTEKGAVQALVHDVERTIGPIERVYNAAAIMPTASLLSQDLDTLQRVMNINYGGVATVTKCVLPYMQERGRGELVQFASMAGWVPLLDFGAYNASKFAVVAFSEVLAHELRGSGIRVACVCPPPVDTPLLDQATSKPKILSIMPPIRPDQVLDAVERALARGRLWVFPGFGSTFMWRARRIIPGIVWRFLHLVERR